MKKKGISALLFSLILSLTVSLNAYADWESISGLEGIDLVEIAGVNGFDSNGRAFIDYAAIDSTGNFHIKYHGDEWRILEAIPVASFMIPIRNDDGKTACAGASDGTWNIGSTDIGGGYWNIGSYIITDGIEKDNIAYIVVDTGLVYSRLSNLWTLKPGFPAGTLCLAMDNNSSVYAATATAIYQEDAPGSETFTEILAGIDAPKQLVAYSSELLYLLDDYGQLHKISYDDISLSWDIELTAYAAVKYIISDGIFLYILTEANEILRVQDGVFTETLPVIFLTADPIKNCLSLNGSELYAGTDNGVYKYSLVEAPPENISLSTVDSTLTIFWESVSGAVGYKVFAFDATNSWTEYDAGDVLSYSIDAAGVVAVKVVAYDQWGYETTIIQSSYFYAQSAGDLYPPSQITNLTAEPVYEDNTAVKLKWTAPADDYLCTKYSIKYNNLTWWYATEYSYSFDGSYNATNPYLYYLWYYGLSTEHPQSIIPALPGSQESIVITGLDTDAPHDFAITSSDATGKESVISNNANAAPTLVIEQPLYGGPLKLVWDESPEENVIGYYIYIGDESRNYTRSVQIIGKTITSKALVELGLALGTHYIAITAYTDTGDESYYSNEIVFSY